MNNQKIAEFIKKKRKHKGLTQEELASKLYVTEKAISRWETGRGTPDISLLLPLAKELDCEVKDILNGEENIKNIVSYNEENKKDKYNIYFKFSVLLYLISLLVFLFYLRREYNTNNGINYLRVIYVIVSSLFSIGGYQVLVNKVIDKKSNQLLLKKVSIIIIFCYYSIYLFNVTMFSRIGEYSGINIIPFKSILEVILNYNNYQFLISIVGNIVIFLPFGYFIPKIFNKINNVRKFSIVMISVIVIIELLQLIFKCGVFDIDDIILNYLGAIIMFLIIRRGNS